MNYTMYSKTKKVLTEYKDYKISSKTRGVSISDIPYDKMILY